MEGGCLSGALFFTPGAHGATPALKQELFEQLSPARCRHCGTPRHRHGPELRLTVHQTHTHTHTHTHIPSLNTELSELRGQLGQRSGIPYAGTAVVLAVNVVVARC